MEILFDEGYQFGMGVFETVAVERGNPLFLRWHLERMANSLQELGIEQTVTEHQVREYLAACKTDRAALKILASEKNVVLRKRYLQILQQII